MGNVRDKFKLLAALRRQRINNEQTAQSFQIFNYNKPEQPWTIISGMATMSGIDDDNSSISSIDGDTNSIDQDERSFMLGSHDNVTSNDDRHTSRQDGTSESRSSEGNDEKEGTDDVDVVGDDEDPGVLVNLDEADCLEKLDKIRRGGVSGATLKLFNIHFTDEIVDILEQILESGCIDHIEFYNCLDAGADGTATTGCKLPRSFGSARSVSVCRLPIQQNQLFFFSDNVEIVELAGVVIQHSVMVGLEKALMNSQIRVLNLRDSGIMDHQVLASALRPNQSLHRLVLDECNLQDEPLSCIISAVRDHPSLKYLDIDSNKCRSRSVNELALMLQSKSSQLRSLEMAWNSTGSNQEINVGPIMAALHKNTSLKHLSLGANNLDNSFMSNLSQMLRENSTLEHLQLFDISFGNEDLKIFCEHMPYYHSLRSLDLEGPKKDAESLRMLVAGLADNHTIEDILVTSESPGRERKVLNYWLDLNWGGRRLILNRGTEQRYPKNKCIQFASKSLWPYVFERANKAEKDPLRRRFSTNESKENRTHFLHQAKLKRRPVAADIIYFFLKNGSFAGSGADPDRPNLAIQ